MNRREFISGAAMAAMGAATPTFAAPAKGKLRGVLLHLSMNMWGGYLAPGEKADPKLKYAPQYVRCDRKVWNAVTELMQRRKYNFAVIDVGDTLNFPSHPELAIKGGWSPDELKAELARLRGMGIEPVPKLNFSACHDAWLKEYGRMLSTPKYYQVVSDLINDVCEVFGSTRFFHLGMDEENAALQRTQNLIVFRQGEQLWKDAYWMFDTVAKHGVQPMVFATSWARMNPEEYFKRMPKSVVQNLGVYGACYDEKRLRDKSLKPSERNPYGLGESFNQRILTDINDLRIIGERGYPFLSCSSNFLWTQVVTNKNPKADITGRNCPQEPRSCAWLHELILRTIPDETYLGEMVAPWRPILPQDQYYTECGINQLADALDGIAHAPKGA